MFCIVFNCLSIEQGGVDSVKSDGFFYHLFMRVRRHTHSAICNLLPDQLKNLAIFQTPESLKSKV